MKNYFPTFLCCFIMSLTACRCIGVFFKVEIASMGSFCTAGYDEMPCESLVTAKVTCLAECALWCTHDDTCLSFNFQFVKSTTHHRCEMMQERFSQVIVEALYLDAVQQTGYQYYIKVFDV